VWVAAVAPVPDNETVAGEFDALLLTVSFPVAASVADGANVEVSVVDCPGERGEAGRRGEIETGSGDQHLRNGDVSSSGIRQSYVPRAAAGYAHLAKVQVPSAYCWARCLWPGTGKKTIGCIAAVRIWPDTPTTTSDVNVASRYEAIGCVRMSAPGRKKDTWVGD
jgi:hypothetical protein